VKLILLPLLVLSFLSAAQPLEQFNEDRTLIDKRLMIGLGSWATANFISSGIGWATVSKGEAYYFHQMNVLWNTVNMGLAIPGYFKAKKGSTNLSLEETKKAQRKTENIFLVNTGLDAVYISSGFLLRGLAKKDFTRKDQYNGFGNGIILQGGFLLLFDLTAYAIHGHHANKSLYKTQKSIEMSPSGLGMKWNLGVKPFSGKQVFM
jgi:hypothetical protein